VMKQISRALAGVVLLLNAFGCSNGKVRAAAPPPPPVVEVAPVIQKNVPVQGEWVGTLEGYVNAQIQPQVTGYLIRQDYREGGLVKKDQLLFEIDPRPFQAVLDQAKGQLAQIQPQVTGYLIRQDYREGGLVKKDQLLFEIDPRPFQAVLDQAKGQLAQAQAQ